MILKEIDFCGVYLPPFFLYLLVAGALYLPLHWYWDRVVIQRRVWNRPIFELAVFTILLALIAFIL